MEAIVYVQNLPKSETLLVLSIVVDPIPGGHVADGTVPSLSSDANAVCTVALMVLRCSNQAFIKGTRPVKMRCLGPIATLVVQFVDLNANEETGRIRQEPP